MMEPERWYNYIQRECKTHPPIIRNPGFTNKEKLDNILQAATNWMSRIQLAFLWPIIICTVSAFYSLGLCNSSKMALGHPVIFFCSFQSFKILDTGLRKELDAGTAMLSAFSQSLGFVSLCLILLSVHTGFLCNFTSTQSYFSLSPSPYLKTHLHISWALTRRNEKTWSLASALTLH